jgi:hypothetical protein
MAADLKSYENGPKLGAQKITLGTIGSVLGKEGASALDLQEGYDPGLHYRYEYKGIKLDPYRIAEIYRLNDPALFTILKKTLRAGRAHKDLCQDLKDIINAAERRLEMLIEDKE